MGEAAVDGDEARAHQISYAEGNFINPMAITFYELEERLWFYDTKSFESWAWTNANTHGAIIDP